MPSGEFSISGEFNIICVILKSWGNLKGAGKRHMKLLYTSIISLTIVICFGAYSYAAELTWLGNNSVNLSDAANWGGTAPVGGDSLKFGAQGTQGNALTNDYATGLDLSGITFTENAPSYKITGNWTKLSGNITNNSTSAQTLEMGHELSGNVSLNALAGDITIQTRNSVNLKEYNLTIDGPKNTTIKLIVSGATNGFILKKGSGTFTSTAACLYTGGTVISSGTFRVQNVKGAGTGKITLGDADTASSDIKLQLAHSGDPFTNAIEVSSLAQGNVSLEATQQFAQVSSNITVNAPLTLKSSYTGTDDWWERYSGIIGGTGPITVIAGTNSSATTQTRIWLSGNNTFSGGVTIQSGKLQLDNTNAAGTGTITLGNSQTGNSSCVLHLGSDINNDIILSTDAPDSTFVISTFNRLQTPSSKLYLNRDLTIYGASDRLSFTGAWIGSGNVTIQGGRVTSEGNAADWTGSLTINADSMFQVNGSGAVSISKNNAVINNGTLGLNACSPVIGALSGSGELMSVAGTGAFTINSEADSVFTGKITNGAGNVGITKAGGGSFYLVSEDNTYTGATLINEGNFYLGRGEIPGKITQSSVTVKDGALLGGVGTLGGSVTIEEGATLSPGFSPGTLQFTNGLDMSGEWIAEIASLSLCDTINVTGSPVEFSSSDGSLDVVLLDDYVPVYGDEFTLLTSSEGINTTRTDWNSLLVEPDRALWNLNLVGNMGNSTLVLSVRETSDPVPEPSSWLLLFSGIAGLFYFRRK